VAGLLYDFFWGDYCDWFVEAAKPVLNGSDSEAKSAILAVMDTVLSGFLRLLHPLMPHLTEELWARLGFLAPVSASGTGDRAQFLLYATPPAEDLLATAAPAKAATAQARVAALYGAVHAARNLRSEFKLPTQQQIRLLVLPKEPLSSETLAILGSLTRAAEVTVVTEAPAGTPSLVTDLGTLFLPLEGLVDLDAERKRIATEITKVEAEITKVNAKLADPNFTEKVPPAVLEEHRERQAKWTEKLDSLQSTLQTLG